MDILRPDLTEWHMAALAVVEFDKSTTPMSVASALGISPDRAARLLKDLELSGLLVARNEE